MASSSDPIFISEVEEEEVAHGESVVENLKSSSDILDQAIWRVDSLEEAIVNLNSVLCPMTESCVQMNEVLRGLMKETSKSKKRNHKGNPVSSSRGCDPDCIDCEVEQTQLKDCGCVDCLQQLEITLRSKRSRKA